MHPNSIKIQLPRRFGWAVSAYSAGSMAWNRRDRYRTQIGGGSESVWLKQDQILSFGHPNDDGTSCTVAPGIAFRRRVLVPPGDAACTTPSASAPSIYAIARLPCVPRRSVVAAVLSVPTAARHRLVAKSPREANDEYHRHFSYAPY